MKKIYVKILKKGGFKLKKNKYYIIPILCFVIAGISVVILTFVANKQDSIYTLSKVGSTGAEVKKIQTILRDYGVYTGKVDGIYGTKTKNAVKSFQRYNGLTVDGIAGPQTLKKMGITSGGTTSSSNNVNLLARLVHGEARGEPYVGQVAVAAVVLNRVKSSKFPNSIAGVIYQAGAFDAVSDGQINMAPSQSSINAATDAINGWDPSYGAIYYFNPNTATNKWIWSRPLTVTIGGHRFCK